MIKKIYLLSTFCTASALAMGPKPPHSFEAFTIPGAKCGNGSDYKVHIKAGDPKKYVFHFQSGGACWNWETCYGPVPFAGLGENLDLGNSPIVTRQPNHPLKDYTYVYMPYCTADVFAGTHQATYLNQHPYHYGRINVEKTFEWLKNSRGNPMAELESVFVYGESAGALGVLVNLDVINRDLPSTTKKYLLSDSPGLHFDDSIWFRFSSPYLKDLSDSMAKNGLRLYPNRGLIAREMIDFCRANQNWRVGVLQGSEDIVMSGMFGNTTPMQHDFRVYGRTGIYQVLQNPSDQCAAWVPQRPEHVFMTNEGGRNIKASDGVSANDFLAELLNDSSVEFKSHR